MGNAFGTHGRAAGAAPRRTCRAARFFLGLQPPCAPFLRGRSHGIFADDAPHFCRCDLACAAGAPASRRLHAVRFPAALAKHTCSQYVPHT